MKCRTTLMTLFAAALMAACEIIEPPEVEFQPTIVVTAAPEFADVMRDVNGVHLSIFRTDGEVRDTVLDPRVGQQQVRARAVLRPDEGVLGTEIGVVLTYDHPMTNDVPLFSGLVVLDPQSGWPFEARLSVEAVATLEVGADWLIARGDHVPLDELTPIVFLDGRARPSADITWVSTDTSVVRVVDDLAIGQNVGVVGVVGVWNGQSDTLLVEVAPSGTIVLSKTSVLEYVGPTDQVADSITVTNFQVGEVGSLRADVDPAYPWLSAKLTPDRPTTLLEVQIAGNLLPSGGAVGEVVVSSFETGVSDAVVTVDVRGEPSSGVETRTWSPLCVMGDSISPPNPGVVACVDLRARAWAEGGTKRVVLEIQNLLGSLGGSLDTADLFVIHGFGIAASVTASPVLLGVRPNGVVGRMGTPTLPYLSGFRVYGFGAAGTAILGCSSNGWTDNAFTTCDPLGQTGSVRVDFQVADTSWALADAFAILDVAFPGLIGQCSTPGSRYCFVP